MKDKPTYEELMYGSPNCPGCTTCKSCNELRTKIVVYVRKLERKIKRLERKLQS